MAAKIPYGMPCRLLTMTEETSVFLTILYVGHKKPVDAQIKLVELVRFFMEVNIHQHATYFVDSLWDNTDVLRVRLLAPYHLSSLLYALSHLSPSFLSNPPPPLVFPSPSPSHPFLPTTFKIILVYSLIFCVFRVYSI